MDRGRRRHVLSRSGIAFSTGCHVSDGSGDVRRSPPYVTNEARPHDHRTCQCPSSPYASQRSSDAVRGANLRRGTGRRRRLVVCVTLPGGTGEPGRGGPGPGNPRGTRIDRDALMRTMSWLRRRVVGSGVRDKGGMPNDGSARASDEMRRRALAAARGRLLELRARTDLRAGLRRGGGRPAADGVAGLPGAPLSAVSIRPSSRVPHRCQGVSGSPSWALAVSRPLSRSRRRRIGVTVIPCRRMETRIVRPATLQSISTCSKPAWCSP